MEDFGNGHEVWLRTFLNLANGIPSHETFGKVPAALDPGAADLVMKLTDEVVRRLDITTVMVTHSMRQALDYGNRIVMLHQGRVMLDISGAERTTMKMDDLLRLFRRRGGDELADDKLLLD